MQTRRDQLQAYRFQNRRALAALVTGEPNVLEPPMRRLTVTTLSGIMIAILIAAGFAAVGIIHPSAGDDWKNPHAVIVDRDNSSTYVYINKTLYPVLNYTSGVLAVSGTQSGSSSGSVTRVQVSSSDISKATYGPEIGISDVPSALPSAGSLVNFPMSVCSIQKPDGKGGAVAAVSLRIKDASAGDTAVPRSHGVVVRTPSQPTPYLLTDGERLKITSRDIGSQLGFDSPPLVVGTAFLDSIPAGPDLAAPMIPGNGTRSSYAIGETKQLIGTIVQATDTDQSYIVLAGGLQRLDAVEAALFVGNPGPVRTTSSVIDSAQKVDPSVPNPVTDLGRGLPSGKPINDDASGDRTGMCAVYDKSTSTGPRFALSAAAGQDTGTSPVVHQSLTSRAGRADRVLVPTTMGVLATPANNPHTVVIISDQGVQYPFASNDLLASFGYAAKNVTKVPAALLHLIPTGSGLSTKAAQLTVPR